MPIDKEFLCLMKKNGFKILEVSNDWTTPSTNYPSKEIGSAKICKDEYREGLYLMEGVDGYDFFWVKKRIPITILKINEKGVMLNDPLHEIGMKKLAECSSGKVLLGGLGLGIIVHYLEKNPNVESIDVVEYNQDVIELIEPLIPKTKTKIHLGSIFDDKWKKGKYDTIILDLWVRSDDGEGIAGNDEKRNVTGDMLTAFGDFKTQFPKANVFIWGTRNPNINPSIPKLPSSKYIKFVERLNRL